MSTNTKLIAAALGMAGLFGTLGAATAGTTLDQVISSRTLTIATNSDYPPQAFLDANNQLDGFDIEVSKEIAKRIGVKAAFVTPGWEIMTAGNWAGRWQIAVGSITPTKKRAEVLDFPAVYYYTPAAFAVHKDAPYTKLADLNGKHFGVVSASVYEAYLKHDLTIDAVGTPAFKYQVTPGDITTYTEVSEVDDLALGDGVRLDSVLQAMPTINAAIKAGKPIKKIGEAVFFEPLAVATDKGDKEFNDKIAAIVKEMQTDGTLKTLSEKWYGTDYTTAK